MSGVSGCRVPETQRDPIGKGIGGSPDFCGSAKPDGSLPQSSALLGPARGCGVSSSAAPHLHFPNSGPLYYLVHLTTGEE